MRWIPSTLIIMALYGCASSTARVGMTIAEFHSACPNAAEHALTTGEVVVICPHTGRTADMQFQLFEDGELQRLLPEEELIALLEHDRCQPFGTSGTPEYDSCRIAFAEQRAEIAANLLRRRARDWPQGVPVVFAPSGPPEPTP